MSFNIFSPIFIDKIDNGIRHVLLSFKISMIVQKSVQELYWFVFKINRFEQLFEQ